MDYLAYRFHVGRGGTPAYAAFLENETGMLKSGNWADVSVLSIDPLNVGLTDPARLFDGEVMMTIVGGNVVFQQEKLSMQPK